MHVSMLWLLAEYVVAGHGHELLRARLPFTIAMHRHLRRNVCPVVLVLKAGLLNGIHTAKYLVVHGRDRRRLCSHREHQRERR